MARLQILELPEGDDDDRPPFVLVIDQFEPQRYMLGADQELPADPFDGIAERIGARAILAFQETIEIPANEVPVDPDGYPLKIRVEPDFEEFRTQVQEEVLAAREKITRALPTRGRPTHPYGTPYTYSQIIDAGWDYCDGCGTWSQNWTPENPHNCASSLRISAG